jgi:predicted branched-subunit amino acid permease
MSSKTERSVDIDGSKDRVTFTWRGMKRGAAAAQAMSVSVLVYGLAFGLMSRQIGLSAVEASLTSTFVNSGSAQLAAVTTIASGGFAATTLAATTLIINARYILFGASLRPWLGRTAPLNAYASLFFLGDGNWMLSMNAHAEGERDAGYVFGSGLQMFAAWLVGTLLGNMGGAILPDPKRLGLDFMLAAFAAAMMVGMAKTRMSLVPLIAGAGAAILVHAFASVGWAIVAAGLAGAGAAALRSPSERAA